MPLCPSASRHHGKHGTVLGRRRRVHSQIEVACICWHHFEGNTPELAYSEYGECSAINIAIIIMITIYICALACNPSKYCL